MTIDYSSWQPSQEMIARAVAQVGGSMSPAPPAPPVILYHTPLACSCGFTCYGSDLGRPCPGCHVDLPIPRDVQIDDLTGGQAPLATVSSVMKTTFPASAVREALDLRPSILIVGGQTYMAALPHARAIASWMGYPNNAGWIKNTLASIVPFQPQGTGTTASPTPPSAAVLPSRMPTAILYHTPLACSCGFTCYGSDLGRPCPGCHVDLPIPRNVEIGDLIGGQAPHAIITSLVPTGALPSTLREALDRRPLTHISWHQSLAVLLPISGGDALWGSVMMSGSRQINALNALAQAQAPAATSGSTITIAASTGSMSSAVREGPSSRIEMAGSPADDRPRTCQHCKHWMADAQQRDSAFTAGCGHPDRSIGGSLTRTAFDDTCSQQEAME